MNIIHIGSWKTATTTIQTLCRKNVSKLEENGYGFIDQRSKAHGQEFQPKFRRAIRDIQSSGGNADIGDSIRVFKELYDNKKFDCFFHSWEGMLGHPFNSSRKQMYHPNATSHWLEKLNDETELKVVVTIRKQSELVEAMYAQEVRKGRVSSGIDKFINEKLPEDMSWASVIKPVVDKLGEEKVRVVPYEWTKKGDNSFLKSVFEGVVDIEKINTELHSNPSYSHIAVEISRLANLYLDGEDISKLEKFLADSFSNLTHRRSNFLTSELVEEVKRRCSSKDEVFFKDFFPDLELKKLGYY